LLLGLDDCLEKAHKTAKLTASGQVSMFGEEDATAFASYKLAEVQELELDKLLMFEKELLGFYLHKPPYLEKLKQLENAMKMRIGDVKDQSIGSRVTFGGVITEIKKVLTKKNASEMAFVTISDGISDVDTVVFPKTYALSKSILNKEEVVVVGGKLDKREEEISILVDTVEVFDAEKFFVLDIDDSGRPGMMEDKAREESYTPAPLPNESIVTPVIAETAGVEIEIPKNAGGDLLKQINSELKKYPGNIHISILLPSNGSFKRLNLPFTIDPAVELLKSLEQLLGANAVKVN
jgi:DNA polymerase III alpha subunit